MTNLKTNLRYELMKTEVEKAKEKGDFKTQIVLAERLGLYLYAGKVSMKHGLIKRAYENFKKCSGEIFFEGEYYEKPLDLIEPMIFSTKFLKKDEIQDNEYYQNKGNLEIKREYDLENKNKTIENRIHGEIIDNLKKYSKGNEFSCERIMIYN